MVELEAVVLVAPHQVLQVLVAHLHPGLSVLVLEDPR